MLQIIEVFKPSVQHATMNTLEKRRSTQIYKLKLETQKFLAI